MNILKNKIPPPIILLLMLGIMWCLNRYHPLATFDFPMRSNIVYFLVLIGLALDFLSLLNFRKNKTTVNPLSPEKTNQLVISGFYRFSRNPMYLGMLLILTAAILKFGSISSVIIFPIFIMLINYLQISSEEIALETLFGEEYRNYKKKVRRWV